MSIPRSVCIVVLSAFLFHVSTAQTVTAYYSGSKEDIARYDPKKLTHIIYSFCHLKGNTLNVDNANDTARIKALVNLKKQNSNLKVLLSLGGWGGCPSCSDVFSTKEARKEFALSVKALCKYFKTDGIDLDWEYPAIEGHPGHAYKSEDNENFTELVKELRKGLGAKKEISFAAGGFKKFIDESIDWQKVMPVVDRVNPMSYDLINGYSATTGHHTALYSTPSQSESTANGVELLLAKGVPANKIVIGAAFYARVWENVDSINNGLYRSGKFKTSVAWRDFEKYFRLPGSFFPHWDSTASAPYYYNPKEKLFATFDDERSIAAKVEYLKRLKLNGIMFWELSLDLPAKGSLVDAIDKATQRK